MKKLTIEKLAGMLKAELIGNKEIEITGVASLIEAGPNELSFLGNKQYVDQLHSSKAGAILIPKDLDEELPKDKTFVLCDDTNSAFTIAIDYFAPPPIEYKPGIHPTAVIAESARIGEGCHIGACAVIEENAVIGKNTVICANVYIGHEAKIGSDCLIYPSTVIRDRCIIGNKVIIHPNVTIGADGYGYAPSPLGIVKIPQVGIVQIDDEVEIGANSTIDRARFGRTWIKHGAKIDSQVMIAHNVIVGEFSMLIGQCGLAGSATIGKGVVVAAQSGVNGHTLVGDGATVGPCSVVKDNVAPGTTVIGYPAELPKVFMLRHTLPKAMKQVKEKIKKLESIVATLKK